MEKTVDVVIVGGGAAGLLAAVNLSTNGVNVLILEKMEQCGRKMLICGKGRCNVTNECEVEDFLKQVKHNRKFLYSALYSFPPASTMHFFEARGVALKTERGNRVFPVSDKSRDVVDALVNCVLSHGGEIRTHAKVQELIFDQGGICGVSLAQGEMISCKKVLVCTGGVSYPRTGSDGDGYKFASKTGHQLVEPSPALIPIELKGDVHAHLQGLSLKNIVLKVKDKTKNKIIYEELGEMIFTHFGISGPLVLRASFYIDHKNPENYDIFLDLKPGLTEEMLDARILRDFGEQINKDFSNVLGGLLPKKMISVMIHKTGIPADKKVHQITGEERKILLNHLKGFHLEVKHFRPIEEGIVTAGGVSVKDINPSTMESKKIKGLYFAGELVDVDAYTGGFNLQIAFATGMLASNSILEEME